ncbi:hypothetical protein PJF56_19180 [Roseofilum sp. BLCC_M91]|uniref:Uncharacterized protein n=1 Tax=Roseofilum halophilum BLCC-M91 TaxID=3022259 RepID=A0ABT7BP77_9CYAN|nr:hypothetical protein [Roseofilum halophilum]MDJ1180987.1 hypothetical protein [Roseofilum halophilum BLCC-M91]
MTQSQRILICTLVALASSGFGFAVGGNFQLQSKMQACQDYSWGFNNVCQLWVGPSAWLQGSTTGAWVGIVLGGFLAGLSTSKISQENHQENRQLTPEEQAELERVLGFLETKAMGVEQLTSRERLILALGMQLSQNQFREQDTTEPLKVETVEKLISSLGQNSQTSGKLPSSEEDNDGIGP